MLQVVSSFLYEKHQEVTADFDITNHSKHSELIIF